jgi:6-methylsalicylate decarboxylase
VGREDTPLDRRKFLKVAAAGMTALAAPALAGAQQPAQPEPPAATVPDRLRIDVHGHYYPDAYLDMLDRFGGGGTGTGIARGATGSGSAEELAARFDMLDRAGVKMQVLSCGPQFPYFENRLNAVAAARFINDASAEIVARYPDRFVAHVVTPLPHVDDSLEEMARGLDTLGMVGVTMGTSVLEMSVADPAFDRFWDELNRRGAILFFHPHGLGACSPLVQQDNLTWPIGATIEDTVCVAHLLAGRISQRYPRVRIIVPHLGGEISMLLERLDHQSGMFLPPHAERPSVTARRFWYDTVAHAHPPALRCACDSLGTDRMLLGSDYPYEVGEVYQRCVDYIADAGLTAAQVEAIRDRNAQALFRLVPKPSVNR